MKKIIFVLIIALLSSSLMSQERVFHDKGMKKTHSKEKHFKKKRKRLFKIPDLNEKQKEQIATIKEKTRRNVFDMKKNLMEKEVQLKTASVEKTVNMNRINSLIEEIGEIKTEMAKKHAASKQEIRKLLNDKQRLVFDEHILNMKKRRHRFKPF